MSAEHFKFAAPLIPTDKRTDYVLYLLLPCVAGICMTLYGAYTQSWPKFFVGLALALAAGGFAYHRYLERLRMLTQSVTVDTTEKLLIFRNFMFTTAPAMGRPEERIQFHEIIAADPSDESILLQTTKGTVCITNEIDRFHPLSSMLVVIAQAAAARYGQDHAKCLEAVPPARTP